VIGRPIVSVGQPYVADSGVGFDAGLIGQTIVSVAYALGRRLRRRIDWSTDRFRGLCARASASPPD
jgi:hypothetical protein